MITGDAKRLRPERPYVGRVLKTARERPLVRIFAGALAAASLWAAWQGPLDESKLALIINWTELVGGAALAIAAFGFRMPTGRA